MYLAFLDEAGHTKAKSFTVCGLTAIKIDDVVNLCNAVEALRSSYPKLTNTDLLKFVQSKKSKLNPKEHQELKQSVLKTAHAHNVKFWGYAYFNEAAKKFDADRNRLYGFNVLIGKFNTFLKKQNEYGSITIDRLDLSKKSMMGYNSGFDYLKEKFQQGNFQQPRKSWIKQDRIISFSMACEGTSHLSSVNDILTGSLMYLVNGPSDNIRKAIQEQLQKIMTKGPTGEFRDYGLSLYPKNRTRLDMSVDAEYGVLRAFLNTPK